MLQTPLLHLVRNASSSYPKDWKSIGTEPSVAGHQKVYQDTRPQSDEPTRIPRRVTSVVHGGGGGAPYQQPYMQPKPINIRYNPRLYEGGLLPRLEHTDEPVRLPDFQPRDVWAPHRAHFGQNDYVDILSDGQLTPRDFYTGPPWVFGARNEFQRVCARVNNPVTSAWLAEFEPSTLHLIEKRHTFLYKKVNKRKNIKFRRYRDSP